MLVHQALSLWNFNICQLTFRSWNTTYKNLWNIAMIINLSFWDIGNEYKNVSMGGLFVVLQHWTCVEITSYTIKNEQNMNSFWIVEILLPLCVDMKRQKYWIKYCKSIFLCREKAASSLKVSFHVFLAEIMQTDLHPQCALVELFKRSATHGFQGRALSKKQKNPF